VFLNNMKISFLKVVFLGILFFFFSMEVSAMGFNKVLFSKVHGVVLNHGKPIPDAVVTRFFNFGWTNEEMTETFKTGEDGIFDFPVINRFSLATSIFPHEPSIGQIIKIHYDKKEYVAWALTKSNYEENGELNGKPINLLCELTQESRFDDTTHVIGICKIR
jgi:hypothetical protein